MTVTLLILVLGLLLSLSLLRGRFEARKVTI